jgi:hypothetical protein
MEQIKSCSSDAGKADARRRMSPLHRQSAAQISSEMYINVVTLYNCSKAQPIKELCDQDSSLSLASYKTVYHRQVTDLTLPLSGRQGAWGG